MKRTLSSRMGKLVDVGGCRLHSYFVGEGDPTVVFEAGGGGWSLDWHLIQSEVATFTRTCSYDRAVFGWSDPGPKPRSSARIVEELHALLVGSGAKPPYVLVGASFGGHTARFYAHRHPDEVAGIVLVDARHEAIDPRMPPAWKRLETAGKGMYSVMLWASRLGLLKAFGSVMGEKALPPILSRLPPEMQPTYLDVGFQPKCVQASLDELAAAPDSDQQLSATGSLGDMPLVVITHGTPEMFAQMPAEQANEAEQIWQQLQVELSRLSSNGRLLVARKSGHRIPIDEPELVIGAIREMVGAMGEGSIEHH